MSSFDLAVAYRIYPRVAKPAVGLPFSNDKLDLSEICLRSFKNSVADMRVKVWVLLDGCPPEYQEIFRRYFDDQDLVLLPLDHVGNRAAFGKQIDILLEQEDSDLIYFAEDDYFYRRNQFRRMADFLKANSDVHFVTPYDHPDCYRLEIHRRRKWIRAFEGQHWRTAASTCLTFMARKQTLRQKEAAFRSYCRRNDDCSLWLSLTKTSIFDPIQSVRFALREPRFAKLIGKSWLHGWKQILFGDRASLWVPVPGIATHLDINALSPGIDWATLMEQLANETGVVRRHGEKWLAT